VKPGDDDGQSPPVDAERGDAKSIGCVAHAAIRGDHIRYRPKIDFDGPGEGNMFRAKQVLFVLLISMANVAVIWPTLADYGDKTETEVTIIREVLDGGKYKITFTAINHCHALNLIRVYDTAGKKIFPDDEALGGKAAGENEEYKRAFTVNANPFPVTIDLKEFESEKGFTTSARLDKKCSVTEEREHVDYHRHGPFGEDGKGAAHAGLKAGEHDPNEQIDKDAFNKGPGRTP
jgi:hypothetical protein